MSERLKNCPVCNGDRVRKYGKPEDCWVVCLDCETEAPVQVWQSERHMDLVAENLAERVVRQLACASSPDGWPHNDTVDGVLALAREQVLAD